MSDTFPSGSTVYLTAALLNAESVALPDAPGAWSADQGTITQDTVNPDLATLVNVPDGVVNVTFTPAGGTPVLTYSATLGDLTPASGTITGSLTAPVAPTA